MDCFLHILERQFLHASAAGTVYILAFRGLMAIEALLARRVDGYTRLGGWKAWFLPAFLAAGLFFFREPFDAWNQASTHCPGFVTMAKSYLDYAVWLGSCFGAALLVRSLLPRMMAAENDIQRNASADKRTPKVSYCRFPWEEPWS